MNSANEDDLDLRILGFVVKDKKSGQFVDSEGKLAPKKKETRLIFAYRGKDTPQRVRTWFREIKKRVLDDNPFAIPVLVRVRKSRLDEIYATDPEYWTQEDANYVDDHTTRKVRKLMENTDMYTLLRVVSDVMLERAESEAFRVHKFTCSALKMVAPIVLAIANTENLDVDI